MEVSMIKLQECRVPEIETGLTPITLTDETMKQRKDAVCEKMRQDDFDVLVIYADLEHGGNFEYLAGFLPRFEEAMLILHQDGNAYMVLGNENFNKAGKARLKVTPIHMPHFSLPNQPMQTELNVADILKQCDICNAKKIGLVGWKNFTSAKEDNALLFDIPYFIVSALQDVCKNVTLMNATYIFIGEYGVRTRNNANEAAHYEFGAALAGNCMLQAMDNIEIGKTEMEVAEALAAKGQRHSVVTIMSSGERFVKANMYPSNKMIQKGDRLSLTTGFKGGLQSRGGYAVTCTEELPKDEQDYLDKVAIPYFQAVVTWIENIAIGQKGKELYQIIENVLPKETYGWSLNPGHLCADEEWLSSPIYPNSNEVIQSGMLFQIDIIPSVKGYGGISCESGVLLADANLRKAIEETYPLMWKRIEKRRAYMKETLGINLPEEVLPTSMVTAYCRPYMLNKKAAFIQTNEE